MKVKLSKRVRGLLAGRRKLVAKATLTLTDPAGTQRKMSRTLRLVGRRG